MKAICKPNTLLRHVRDVVIVIAVGMLSFVLFKPEYLYDTSILFQGILYSAYIGTLIWKGNELVGYFIEKKYSWYSNPYLTLKVSIVSSLVYSILAIIVFNLIWLVFFPHGPLYDYFMEHLYLVMLAQLVITIIISSVLFGEGFFKAWRQSAVNEEKLKRESLALQYEALKNQVNPHFLFNSLNALSSLIYKDPELAEKFVRQLSEVYRYVLEQKDKELVDLDTELKFVESYIFLQKIRFGENLQFAIQQDPGNTHLVKIAPLALQILVENAIKHNIVSKEKPLRVSIACENDFIVIRNNLQKRSSVEKQGGIGLANISARYAYLSDKKVIVEDAETEFVVRIPCIHYTDGK